jgi:hypothetical protein
MMGTTRTVQGGAVEEIWPARWMAQAAYREGHTSGLWPGCWEAAIQHELLCRHHLCMRSAHIFDCTMARFRIEPIGEP